MREEEYIPMGLTAENVATRYGVSRREMDEMAVESHRRAAGRPGRPGCLTRKLSPLPRVDAEGNTIVFDKDQGIRRDTTLEKLAGLKPVFGRAAW